MSDPAIVVEDLHRTYKLGRQRLHVLRGVSMRVREGEFVSIIGASGSGKSTLLHLMGLLDKPDRGKIHLSGRNAARMSAGSRNRLRCRDVGFVFQFYHLMPELTVLENTLLPAQVENSVAAWFTRRRGARRNAQQLLDRLGLGERLKHKPRELSGGERQRVAIARALVNQPRLLLADEPTGNLDSKTGASIMQVLQEFHQKSGQTIVMVTHDIGLSRQADRILHLRDGQLTDRISS
jgi:ABC-type lipoprotein export system ATPase subunit